MRAVVGFHSNEELASALEAFPGAKIVRRIPHMKTVEVELAGRASQLRGRPGIAFAHRPLARRSMAEPALTAMFRPRFPYEWQYVATRENEVPEEVLRAAGAVKIGVVDTGADVTHPDLAAKSPETWDVVHHRTSVRDNDGHGTFVSSLATGSVDNAEGIAGFGGDAQLLMVRAVGAGDSFSDVDEAAAIVYAVDHGAKIVNLSIGGEGTSALEQKAVLYAASHNVLLVAAAGNEYEDGNPDRVPRRRASAAWLERTGRVRPLGRSQHDRGQARVLLEHGLADLARRPRRERLRRHRVDSPRRSGGRATPCPDRRPASTAGRAGRRSRAPRSPAQRRSSGPRTRC